MLVLDDVRFAYPGYAETYAYSMRIAPGEIVAVAGPSGAGKSTLLDLIAGFLEPLSGSISLDRRDLATLPPERRPVSILFQTDNLFEHLSAEANVGLGLPAATPRAERTAKSRAALEQVGMAEFAPRRAARLSGGQKQRVALARTLLRDRPVLLLDEPFTALDAEAADSARRLVKALVLRHRWHAVLVSHSETDLDALADRRYSLSSGVLTEA